MSLCRRFTSRMAWLVFAVVACASACLATGISMARTPSQTNDRAAANLDEGKVLFRARCGVCHLAGGTGTFMLARRLGKDRALLQSRTDLSSDFVRKISRVGIGSMPPLNRIELPDGELDIIATYLTRPASARPASEASDKKPAAGGAHE